MSRPISFFGAFLSLFFPWPTKLDQSDLDFTVQRSRPEHRIVQMLQRVFESRFYDGTGCHHARIAARTSHCPFVLADNLAFCDGDAVKMQMSPPKSYFTSFLSPILILNNQPESRDPDFTMQESRFEHGIVHLRIISQNSMVTRRKCGCRVRNIFLALLHPGFSFCKSPVHFNF